MRWFERRWSRRRRLARITRKLFALMAVLTLVVSWGCARAGEPTASSAARFKPASIREQETVNGGECDRLTSTGEIVDAHLWISRADRLPQRFVATFKDREGIPQLKVDFSE